jgi:hypothetical protein
MSRPAQRWDNAVIESFRSTLESGLRSLENFTTRAATRVRAGAWIDEYNTIRGSPGSPACRMTWHRRLRGELLQQTSRRVVPVVAAGLTLVVSGWGVWCNTCGVTTRC